MNSFDRFQKLLISFLLALITFYGGYYFGHRGYLIDIKKNPPKVRIISKYPNSSDLDFSLFWEVWDNVTQNYLDRPVDTKKMMYGAIAGMVSALGDPYTAFLPPQYNEATNNALNGKYQGIGAELGYKEGQLIIVSPFDGSPAKRSGILPGDKILKINGEPTADMNIIQAVTKIRGDAGTIVTLTIQTDTASPRDIDITRGVINVPSVTWEDKGDGIAYIRISRFGSDTNSEWSKAVSEISTNMSDLNSLVIDLRGNPGGYLQSPVYVSGEFFNNKVVVYQEDAEGNLIPYKAERVGVFRDIPRVVVLIDGGSASASEILAASLRDNFGAILVGEQSFGKGTIQDALNFPDGSGLHITISKWLTPKKEWIHKKGLTPDVLVKKPEASKTTIESLDVEAPDVQLEKALEVAKNF